MPARYSALPVSQDAADDELEAAFESDDEEHAVAAPPAQAAAAPAMPMPGAYDFERAYEYDRPPPGSPPRPSALALPNQIGNSNGRLPSGPAARPPAAPEPGALRRALASFLPARYARVPAGEGGPRRAVGAGLDNDGVFANVTAKPSVPRARPERGDDGIYVVPEEVQKEAPPSYAVAQADAVPPYWETTVLAPAAGAAGEMVVDGLPTGTLFAFLWNALISLSFNFVGFLLTYLLHTTHAAKFGARAGLGVTLLQYGFSLRGQARAGAAPADAWPADPQTGDGLPAGNATAPDDGALELAVPYTQEWVAFLFMTFGWFLLLTSLLGYWRVKRWERQIRRSASPPSAEELARDAAVRDNLERIFGLGITVPTQDARGAWDVEQGPPSPTDGRAHAPPPLPPAMSADEARLHRDLRAAGLL